MKPAVFVVTWFGHIRAGAGSLARNIRSSHPGRLPWKKGVLYVAIGTTVITSAILAIAFHHVYLDRTNLPDLGSFNRFEYPTIGHIYDENGRSLMELAKERRRIINYENIPPIVRDAIIATEDKNFFAHSGIDYAGILRVLSKVRIRTQVTDLTGQRRQDEGNSPVIFPQGGSTITQQLVRGHFLQNLTAFENLTAQENRIQLRRSILLPRALSYVIGARSANMFVRKLEEIRLSLWVEKQMQKHYGSKRRAKEEILARYASLIYMGNGQYGFAIAAEHYFGQPLATLTVDDADKAALLASIAKSPRNYAPNAGETGRVLRRRNQTLALMAANGFISRDSEKKAGERPLPVCPPDKSKMLQAGAAVDSVLEELRGLNVDLGIKDLLEGRIQVYSTVDARVQEIVNEALENGLELYEKRHPRTKGMVQGSIVVLRNHDASILAETGGRHFYADRVNLYSDFNRVTKSLRQPGSAMKPIVYLAAFREGIFNLDSMIPDNPICVPDGGKQPAKCIANYDGQFKGLIPIREALAESRNAATIWITEQIGISSILWTSEILGVQTRLRRYSTTALGASEMNLLELANAYRTIASGIIAKPFVIRKIVHNSGEVMAGNERRTYRAAIDTSALSLIQEGLRSVVQLPTGTAHALDSSRFPIAVMGKTGTTNEFRDALFIGSTYGPAGITVAIRIGFDDNRSLGPRETGGRVALPVFKEIMLRVYRKNLAGLAPEFPEKMEQNINAYLRGDPPDGQDLPQSEPSVIQISNH